MLGPREQVRIGATVAFAVAKIQDNLATGLAVRDDEFFRASSGARSAADEIAEGVILAAQREPEELKLRYLGNLLGNIAFDRDIDRAKAHVLVRVAERLSYRQLIYLALLGRHDRYLPDRDASPGGEPPWGIPEDLKVEMDELFNLRLTTPRSDDFPHMVATSITLHETGALLHDLMELHELPVEDTDELTRVLGVEPDR